MKKIIISITLSVIVIITILSFVEIDNSDEDSSNNSIVYAVNSIPNELKDVSKLSTRDEDIICATSKGLVTKDSEGKITPSLASEINIKDDGIEYEFKIREDIYWSDGSRITAEDIREFFRELLKEDKDENIQSFLNVYGAKEFRDGKVTFETGVAIKASENTLNIRLNKKDDKFLDELTKPQYRVRKYLMMWDDIASNYNRIVYSGEYKISNITKDGIELIKNSNSIESSNGKINIISDENEELSMAAFEVGDRDVVVNPPANQLNRLEGEGRLKTFNSDNGKYVCLNSNDDKLSLSLRRTLYFNLNMAMGEYQEQNSNSLELAEGSYFREDKDNLDKLQSRKVMTNSTSSKLPEVITILGRDNNENRSIVKHLQKWFEENTESKVRYTLVSSEEFNNLELRKRYDITLISEVADSKNKEEFYAALESYYTEKEGSLYESIKKSNKQDFNPLEEQLFNNYTIVPLLFENKNVAISKTINNIEFDFYGNINFETLK